MHQRWLAAFHAVARSGGFTAAGKLLNIGQPTVSTHVGLLEDHFRVELFHRRGRRVELTPIGKLLLTITEGLFGYEEEAIQLLRAAQAREIGSLNIGALRPPDAMEISARLLKRHPNLKIAVTIGASSDILNGLLNFDFDAGVIGNDPRDPRFFASFYRRYPIYVVVNADHPLARRRAIRIEELEGQPVVRRTTGVTRTAFDRAIDRSGVRVQPVMETNTLEGVLAAVMQGIGLGVISVSGILRHERLKVLPVTNADMFGEAYVVCLRERRERPLIATFLQCAAEGANSVRRSKT